MLIHVKVETTNRPRTNVVVMGTGYADQSSPEIQDHQEFHENTPTTIRAIRLRTE